MEKINKITNLLTKMKAYEGPVSISNNDRNLLAFTPPSEYAVAQHNMLTSGVTANQLWKLWKENPNILPDLASRLKNELPPAHILRYVMAEHEMFLCFIAELEDINKKIQNLVFATSATEEIRHLGHISNHLAACDQHREREDEVIYDQLQRMGYTGLMNIIYEQHKEIDDLCNQLNILVWRIDHINFDHFKTQLYDFVKTMVPLIGLHIFIENNILFPIALSIINDPQIWEKIKNTCSQIGYCSFDKK